MKSLNSIRATERAFIVVHSHTFFYSSSYANGYETALRRAGKLIEEAESEMKAQIAVVREADKVDLMEQSRPIVYETSTDWYSGFSDAMEWVLDLRETEDAGQETNRST